MPPLDKMRKFRRDIIKSINDYRSMNKVPGVYIDILANKAACEYAEHLLTGEDNETVLTDILNKHLIVGQVTTLVGMSLLEEDDEDGHSRVLHGEFMDAHGVLCELQDDLERMIDAKYTHVGVGFAWNKDKVLVVEFYSVKTLVISQLTESEDGGIDVAHGGLGVRAAVRHRGLSQRAARGRRERVRLRGHRLPRGQRGHPRPRVGRAARAGG